jgi:hypothetical protein
MEKTECTSEHGAAAYECVEIPSLYISSACDMASARRCIARGVAGAAALTHNSGCNLHDKTKRDGRNSRRGAAG